LGCVGIAEDIEALRALEWRQLEETMATVLEGLGFKTTLTSASKDGGKDIVLEYHVRGPTPRSMSRSNTGVPKPRSAPRSFRIF